MKKLLLAILIACLSATDAKAQQEILTNQSILDMLELEFSEEVIITKINTSQCEFMTSIDDLKSLKEKGVSNNIIVAMMKVEKSNQNTTTFSNDAVSGIFFKKGEKMIRIRPTAFSGTKTNTLGTAFTYGIANSTVKSTMIGSTSNNIIETTLPEFYFLFEHNPDKSSLSDWWFAVATSPDQFVLARLDVKGKRRELETGKVNVYAGSSMGVSEEAAIKFHIEEINEHEYKVIPETPLKPGGEYCFFYQGSIPQGGYNNQAVFDFSVSESCRRSNKYPVGSHVFIRVNNKIKKCKITDVNAKNGEIYYTGETSSYKEYEWKEADCSSDKEDLE